MLKSNHITSERSNQRTRPEIDWLYSTVHVKDQVLRNVFGGIFSDSLQQNLSTHPHCRDILQSNSGKIWDFLPSFWGCLLNQLLEIYVPNDKFGFSEDYYFKLPTKFRLHSFELFFLQISSDAKYFNSFLLKALWSSINSSYSIQVLLLRSRVNLGAIVRKSYSILHRYLELEPYHQIQFSLIYISWVTVVGGELKTLFSIATTRRCKEERSSFPWIAPLFLDPYLIMLLSMHIYIYIYYESLCERERAREREKERERERKREKIIRKILLQSL